MVVVARTGLEHLMERGRGLGPAKLLGWRGEGGRYSGCDRLGLKGRGRGMARWRAARSVHAMIDCTDPRRSARFRVGTVHAHPTIMSTNCNSHPLCESPLYFVEGERVS